MTGTAIFDGTATYRYRLTRRWDDGPTVCFVMLNPSTADADKPDPTITRCIGFAKSLDAGALDVVNLFALRSTDPAELARVVSPIGPDNDDHIADAAGGAEMVICAWGAHPFAKARARRVAHLITLTGARPMCLRMTKGGHPAHPLYLPASLRPVPMERAA